MEIIFLKAKQKLVKEITTEGTKPYPLAKNFTSEHHTIEPNQKGFNEFYELLQTHAAAGHALHKGDLKKKLKNESRALMTDRTAATQLLVLDLDGVTFPGAKTAYNTYDIQNIAEAFVQYLPQEFKDVSYIAQASASLGLKPNKISLHLFFLLGHTVQPRALKEWLRTLNYEIDFLADQLSLSANGQSISYPLDVSLADNSKLVYIGTPKFTGVQDPVTGDRFVKIDRGSPTLNISHLMKDVNPEKVYNLSTQIKDGLRKKAGLVKKSEKITTVNVNGISEQVLQNPDRMSIEICRIADPYVNCNINGGDSGAYYLSLIHI